MPFAIEGPEPLDVVSVIDQAHRAAVQEHFDAIHYLAANPDVQITGMDPLDHFLLHGWLEGRNPSPLFDVSYYLATNPDVAAHGINPLLHYVWVGIEEGRRPRRPLNTARRYLDASLAPREKALCWAGAADQSEPMTQAALSTALAQAVGQAGMAVSVSHDDYALNHGGVQNLIADEQRAFEKAGWSYLHVSPAAPIPMLADFRPASSFRVRVRLDGKAVGIVSFQVLVEATAALRGRHHLLEVIFHHFIGHAPELLAVLAAAANARPIVWVHDFFTLCPSYTLMRNDVRFCGAPPSASTACSVCVFGPERLAHLPRVQAFFETTRPLVLAPSNSALEFWLARGDLPYSETGVVPLARVVMASHEDEHAAPMVGDSGPLRIAHLGTRVLFKGWPMFEELAVGLAADTRYAFHHLGMENHVPLPKCVRSISVNVIAERREAMIEAIAEHRIDVVIIWSLWPETFCFVVHEALAAGAFVIARSAAGNVWPAVQANAPDQGCVVEDEAGLMELFASGEILRRVARARRLRGALIKSGGTADWLSRNRPSPTASPAARASSFWMPLLEAGTKPVLVDG